MEESNLSFHIELQSEKDSKITSLKDNVYFMVTLFIVTNLIHLTAASYLLNIFPLIALLTLRSLYMIIIPLLYSKMFDHTLLNIDMDCTRLLISNAIFLIIAWFTHYYSL